MIRSSIQSGARTSNVVWAGRFKGVSSITRCGNQDSALASAW